MCVCVYVCVCGMWVIVLGCLCFDSGKHCKKKKKNVKIVGLNDLTAASRLHLLSCESSAGGEAFPFDIFHTDQITTFSVPP